MKHGRWISSTLPGTPPSVNELPLDTRNPKYRRVRDSWIQDVCYLFAEAGNKLPRPLTRVHAHAVLNFTQNRRRDSGNYKAMLEKFLGDALQISHIADDTHDVYTFGEVIIIVDPTDRPGHFLVIDYETEDA